jgi:hypothetical protein
MRGWNNMADKPLLSFSSGELDPVLTDNVTLEKFNKALATARNIVISKTGSILSRFTTYTCFAVKNPDQEVNIYCPPNSDYVLEWGHLYVRVYAVTSFLQSPVFSLQVELAHAKVESDLENLHFTTSKDYVYVFCGGKEIMKLELAGASSAFVTSTDIFRVIDSLTALAVTPVGAPSGYDVDYLMTLVVNGEESLHKEIVTGYNKPIAAGQSNIITSSWPVLAFGFDGVREVRVYSRPTGGGAYGFLGSTTKFLLSGANYIVDFEDIGGLPDYNNGVQDIITKYGLEGADILDMYPNTGIIYQQRLLQTSVDDPEAILTSRPGFQNNFYRDFPYAADSALHFKAGTSGKANVLRFVENDGLIAFTTNGVYTNVGLLNINNVAMERRGKWVINEKIPPLVVPGGVFFVDRSNVIRQLIFSQEIQAYESLEQTIFSNHLFRNRTIKTWCFQDGSIPVIIVTFSDGTWATFTYNFEHQMKAWTRHDSFYPMEQVEGTEKPDRSFFVVNKDGQRYVEVSLPRHVPVDVQVDDSESDKLASTAYMDSIKSLNGLLNYSFDVGQKFDISPVVADTWDGDLTITTNFGMDFTSFTVGQVFRFFNPDDGSEIDLTVVSFPSATEMIVTPSEEFPSEYDQTARIYETFNVITGLDHLEGEDVSVMVDGALVTSPYNDVGNYPTLTVVAGSITLPEEARGAIINVGRPICGDVKTLNISTLEQAPTLIESVNVNKLNIRIHESRGLYCANDFPEEDAGEDEGHSVVGMESLDETSIPVNNLLIGNRFLPPISKRIEKTIKGKWNNQGRISIRQVDPYHFEILSIIPDVEVLKRSDR